jgi:hypothetical protein
MISEALPRAHKRAREAMLRVLQRFTPTVSEVEWLVSSDDPELVVAGYEAAIRQVRKAEVPLALERLQRFSKQGANTHLQMKINHLLEAVKDPPQSR